VSVSWTFPSPEPSGFETVTVYLSGWKATAGDGAVDVVTQSEHRNVETAVAELFEGAGSGADVVVARTVRP
jgi:hypothetical protein